MLVDALKTKLIEAIKSNNGTTKDIIRVALSDIETIEVRQGKLTDDQKYNILRKIIANNDEVIQISPDNKTRCKLLEENNVLMSFLPPQIDRSQLRDMILKHKDVIINCNSDGMAIKFIMTELKSSGVIFNGKDASELVREIRR